MKILITGATGFMGGILCHALVSTGHELRILTRDAESAERKLPAIVRAFEWRSTTDPPPQEALHEIDALIHLAGEPIANARWSTEKKRRIRESRVLVTENLMAAVANQRKKPSVVLSASAVGLYGNRGDEILTDASVGGSDFMARICQDWEEAARRHLDGTGIRLVLLRTGIVLSRRGGMLKKLIPIAKSGIFGPLGSGAQWMSWIHIDDFVDLTLRLLEEPTAFGPFNLTAPEPVRNRDFARALGTALHRPAIIPTPLTALRIVLGADAAEAIVASQRVMPLKVLESLHYKFHFPTLRLALDDVFFNDARRNPATNA